MQKSNADWADGYHENDVWCSDRVRLNNAAVAAALREVADKLTALAQELIELGMQAPLDMVHSPTRLYAPLIAVSSVVAGADAAPTPIIGRGVPRPGDTH